MTEYRLLVIGVGIALGMLFFHRTGYSPGGIITPGLIALELGSPRSLAVALLVALGVSAVLSLAVRFACLYGRQRTAAALLAALAFRAAAGVCLPFADHWIGWVAPGLIGADMQRQGVLPTAGATLATSLATAMAAHLLLEVLT